MRVFAPIALALAACACALSLAPSAARADVHTASSEPRRAEVTKTARISKKKWGRSTVVMSLKPGSVGAVNPGDFVEAAGELQVSVCLKPNPRHNGSPQPCPGRYHSFEPRVSGRLILTGSKRGTQGVPIGGERTIECTHKQPNRNHHCVLSLPWQGRAIGRDLAPCAPRCHLNFVLSAWSNGANPKKHKISIGATNNKGRIKQGKAKISTVVHKGARNKPSAAWQTKQRSRGKVPVAAEGKDRKGYVVMSKRLKGLRAGDQLKVFARPGISIGNLPYNALIRTEVLLTDKPGAADPKGQRRAARVADSSTRISASNGFNCTQGASGFRTPCRLDKTGILSVRKGQNGPVYVNVVVRIGAKGPTPLTRKWRKSHRAHVTKGGVLRIEKYRGSSSCQGCQATGAKRSFSEARSKRDKALVASIRRWGVESGRYSCFSRKGKHICSWTSSGRYGNGPAYKCEQKSFGRRKGKGKKARWTFKTQPCKDALGKSLWSQLMQRQLKPDFAGRCNVIKAGARCKWFAHTVQDDKFCKGFATWLKSKRRWAVDPCRT